MTDTQLENREIRPDADARKNARSTRGRPFGAGNPGRPKGSRNRASALLDAIADGDLQAIVEKVVAKAKDGDVAAPRSRGRCRG
jgi:hypothetical protein